MRSKLTLRLEDKLIRHAKEIAGRKGKSLSQMVADYFEMMGSSYDKHEEFSPLVRSLKGILRDKDVDIQDYYQYLEEKYR